MRPDDLVSALGSILPGGPAVVANYPSWETLPHERLSPRADTVGRRMSVLRRLLHPGEDDQPPLQVVVAAVRSILQPQVAGLGDLEPIRLKLGGEIADGLDGLVERLTDLAYSRVELVERRGEFAVRGGIVDLFLPTDEHPVRVELWGDEIESIRRFAVADQRSLDGDAPSCRRTRGRPRAGNCC